METTTDGRPSRRALLGAGVAGAAALTGAGIAADVLPGRTRLVTTLDAVLPAASPRTAAGPLRSGRFRSRARLGADVGWVLALPPPDAVAPGARLPVVLALHGQGDDASVLARLLLPGFLADAVRAGAPPFAVVAADGGPGYWHARRGGEDAQAMLVEEVLPLLADLSATSRDAAALRLAVRRDDRIGLLGWSAGGYGALLLAERLGAARVAAVAAVSPALWRAYGESAPGAFDDAADFAAHDVRAGRERLRGTAVRVDCGLGDPFLRAAQSFVGELDPATGGGWSLGGHDDAYWRRELPGQLAFLGRALG